MKKNILVQDSNYYDSSRVYEVETYNDDNELTHKLLPCLDTNNTPCFYDTVTDETLYKEGIGTLTYELA